MAPPTGSETNLSMLFSDDQALGPKRKDPFSPNDLPATQKQLTRQTKPRLLSYSAENLDNTGIDELNVEHIVKRTPGVTFNLPELICAILKDESFLDKLTPKISDALWSKLESKYDSLVNDVVKPLEIKVQQQAEVIETHSKTITDQKNVISALESKVKSHDYKVNEFTQTVSGLQQQIIDLDIRLEEQEQYSRRTSLRFHNVPCNNSSIRQMDTDKIIVDLCNKKLDVPITVNELGRTHPIGKVRNGKVQVIARFTSYRHRNTVFTAKKKFKNDPEKIFVTENLTTRRRLILDELNAIRRQGKIEACWSHDVRIFALPDKDSRVVRISCFEDIQAMLARSRPSDVPPRRTTDSHDVDDVECAVGGQDIPKHADDDEIA